MDAPNSLSPQQAQTLLATLQARFEANRQRHSGLDWADVHARLLDSPSQLWSLYQMEETGGAPDVVGVDSSTGQYLFFDCSPESPKGRRSVCYDRESWEARKDARPEDNAMDMAAAMGVVLLDEAQYRYLQTLGSFDTKTSSWILTPPAIRRLGGALFGDRRYDHVFIYHNGASSYYAARGFRAVLRV